MMTNHTSRFLILLAAASCFVTTTAAAQTRVLLCFPGGPGSTEQAQPVVDEFLAKLAPEAGWSKATGTYYNDMAACQKALAGDGAQVLILPLDVYLTERARLKLSPVATLANKETASRYHIVGKAGTTLESLKGQDVATGLTASDAFLSKVAFDGKLNTESDFKLDRSRTALRAVKAVAKDKAKAAILNDVEQKALDGLPMAKDLVTITSGPALPGAIVAGVNSDQSKLGAALRAVCKKDKEVCEKMRVTGFENVDEARLTALEKQLSK